MRPVMMPPRGRLKSIFSIVWPLATSSGLPGSNGRDLSVLELNEATFARVQLIPARGEVFDFVPTVRARRRKAVLAQFGREDAHLRLP